ncbi:MAG: extracellular solute-binding protein [Chloroflexi bacterium]|nr:extracellular solute-binding protein [Chloroflexota bacterium]
MQRIGLLAFIVVLFTLSALLYRQATEQPLTPALGTTVPVGTTPTIAEDRAAPFNEVPAPIAQLVQLTPTPTAEPTPTGERIMVWWPDELYPVSGTVADDVLREQFESFRLTYSTYDLEVRRRRANGLGGILPALRAALPVAPGAVPDLTLMRRSDMVTAATEGLIVPVTDWAPSDILNNLLPGVQELGEINDVLYGIPYALNIVHSIYRETVFDTPPLTFDDVLAAEVPYLFPAGAGQGTMVNWVLLLQYRALDGDLLDETGGPVLESGPLTDVLRFYEQGVRAGIFDQGLLGQTQYNTYWDLFAAGEVNFIAVDTATYLGRRAGLQNIGLAPIPTQTGDPITTMDGWMWVLTTQNPDRQRQARAFLSWIMRVSQQSLFTEALGILPSQQRAFRLWEDDTYADFVQTVLGAAHILPGAQYNNSAAVALQASFAEVLAGASATTAADAALNSLAPVSRPASDALLSSAAADWLTAPSNPQASVP